MSDETTSDETMSDEMMVSFLRSNEFIRSLKKRLKGLCCEDVSAVETASTKSTKSAFADFLQPAQAGFVIVAAASAARPDNPATEQLKPLLRRTVFSPLIVSLTSYLINFPTEVP